MRNRSLSDIAKVLDLYTSKRNPVQGFAFDSRMVEVGDLFFAIKGEKIDGHEFLGEAAQKKAIAAVVDNEYSGSDFGLTLLRVKDVKAALQKLAKCSFAKRQESVIAITGSMGKTTTKEFLATLLQSKFRVFKTEGNQNSQLTIPLALLNLEEEYDVMVLEMGMSAHGHISNLVKIAPPDIAMVTRIAPAGLTDHVGGLEAIAKAKSEIFSSSKTRLGIISAQSAKYDAILYGGNLPKRIYGPEGDDRLFIEEKGIRINDSPHFQLSFKATHLLENFLGAVSVARAMGLSWYDIGTRASEIKPFSKRFETIEKNGITFIQDSYNANPDSVMAALNNLPKAKGKIIGVLGTMPDLGVASQHYHEMVGRVAAKHLDELLCIGRDAKSYENVFSQTGKPVSFFSQLAEIKAALETLAKPGDVVLIKGANSLGLWNLLED